MGNWYCEGADKPYPSLFDNSEAGVKFKMGTSNVCEASYLLRSKGPVNANAVITITYAIEVIDGTPDFVAMETNNTPNSGTVGIMLRRSTDTSKEHHRFWYKAPGTRVNLEPGTYTITAPCNDLVNWSSVYGKSASTVPSSFASLLANLRDIALTFGGGSFYGHGVRVYGGNIKFTVVSATVS